MIYPVLCFRFKLDVTSLMRVFWARRESYKQDEVEQKTANIAVIHLTLINFSIRKFVQTQIYGKISFEADIKIIKKIDIKLQTVCS